MAADLQRAGKHGRPKPQLPYSPNKIAKCTAGRGQKSTAEANSLHVCLVTLLGLVRQALVCDPELE